VLAPIARRHVSLVRQRARPISSSSRAAAHLIADNYATQKHPAVQDWLAKHPRFNMHALHAHRGIMDEHGRAVLSRPHNRATSPQRIHPA